MSGGKRKKESEPSFILYTIRMTGWTLCIVLFLVLVGGSLGSALGYYRVETVLSGSMEPKYGTGDAAVAFAKPKEQISTGDVIIFRAPENYGGDKVMHRVISARLTEAGDVFIRTKGDANNVADPWEAKVSSESVWVTRGKVPYLGYVFHYSKRWWPLFIAIAVSIPMLSYANGRVRAAYGKNAVGAGPEPEDNNEESKEDSNETVEQQEEAGAVTSNEE